MFGHKDEPAPLTDDELVTAGDPHLGVIDAVQAATQPDGTVEWRITASVGKIPHQITASLVKCLPAGHQFQKGWKIPVLLDPHHVDRMIIDESRLAMYDDIRVAQDKEKAEALRATLGDAYAPGAQWIVPSHCPSCGGAVDTAAQALSAHPTCGYCHAALPLEKAPT